MHRAVIGHGIGKALPAFFYGNSHIQLQVNQLIVISLPAFQKFLPACITGVHGLPYTAVQVQLFRFLAGAAAQRDLYCICAVTAVPTQDSFKGFGLRFLLKGIFAVIL